MVQISNHHLRRIYSHFPMMTKTLISTNPQFTTFIPSLPYKNRIFFNFQSTKHLPFYHIKTTSSSSYSCSCSPNYSGWADLSSGNDSNESNQFRKLLNLLGIDEKKYAFVYLLGFVCALAVSRVRVSSIIVFPACFLVFAVGFSFGIVNKVEFKKKKFKGDEFIVLIENLRDFLNGFDVKIVNLKNCMRKDVDCNRISKSDLVSYVEGLESIEDGVLEAKSVIEGYMDCMVVDTLNQKQGNRKKAFDISQIIAGFRDRSFESRPSKVKDNVKNDSSTNFMSPVVEDNKVKPITSDDKSIYDAGDVRVKEIYEGKAMGRMARMNLMEMETGNKQVFDSDEYVFKDRKMRFVKNKNLADDGFLDSDFGASLKQRRAKEFFQQEQGNFTDINGNNMLYDNLESSEEKAYNESRNENGFASSPSSEISNDILFNDYITEANSLLKQSREFLRHRGIEEDAENMLYKSTELLSKAVDMKPMSLLAVGQLGNTYLLHGELKLKHSRKLRAVLAQNDSNVLERLEDEFSNREKFVDYLVSVCEECEELLVKAGRKYRLALSIDGNDMRAFYNWGLALSFRAQLISDIGPEAAFDADKVYLAAIDKFDAMMSKSNSHAPDALFRWGVALQQRSRLRTRNFREKVKLLSQAKRLYEDALLMDSNNSQVKEALSTCVSELRYKNYY